MFSPAADDLNEFGTFFLRIWVAISICIVGLTQGHIWSIRRQESSGTRHVLKLKVFALHNPNVTYLIMLPFLEELPSMDDYYGFVAICLFAGQMR